MTPDRAGRRPLLSVVVPVYGVEPYLRQCLDSILIEGGPDIEVIAVDDASPDRCPAILDGYAAADQRVRVLRLSENAGLGPARNAGLDATSGEYVWFVDSDDWLPAGSVPAVLAALRADHPDVLLLDHLRVYEEDGREETDASSPLLRGVTGAAPLADRPHLLGLQHCAWNKVASRDYLRRLGLRFFAGWYEDYPFSHPLLIAGGTIAVLDRVCYYYRQRADGAITRTVSDRHMIALDQYERTFMLVDRAGPVAEQFRPWIFRLMIDHCLVIAGNEYRLPASRRAEFFHRTRDLYHRYRPVDGYPMPAGVAGLKHRMVAADAYWAYAMLRAAYRLVGRLRGGRRPGTAQLRSAIRRPSRSSAAAATANSTSSSRRSAAGAERSVASAASTGRSRVKAARSSTVRAE